MMLVLKPCQPTLPQLLECSSSQPASEPRACLIERPKALLGHKEPEGLPERLVHLQAAWPSALDKQQT